MKFSTAILTSLVCLENASGFVVPPTNKKLIPPTFLRNENTGNLSSEDSKAKLTEEEIEKVGNLVADDEWMGLSMELTELVRMAVLEDLKKSTRDFTGKDDYKVGDISKELDSRVKDAVADLRGKEEYELGDLTVVLDGLAKDMVCEMTGKDDYEFGDLSVELDARIKTSVASFCGKDTYGRY